MFCVWCIITLLESRVRCRDVDMQIISTSQGSNPLATFCLGSFLCLGFQCTKDEKKKKEQKYKNKNEEATTGKIESMKWTSWNAWYETVAQLLNHAWCCFITPISFLWTNYNASMTCVVFLACAYYVVTFCGWERISCWEYKSGRTQWLLIQETVSRKGHLINLVIKTLLKALWGLFTKRYWSSWVEVFSVQKSAKWGICQQHFALYVEQCKLVIWLFGNHFICHDEQIWQ